MRHVEVGQIKKIKQDYQVYFFNKKISENFKTYKKAFKFSKKILLKFVNFIKEGACFKVIKENGEWEFYLSDFGNTEKTKQKVVFFGTSAKEYFLTHYFYMKPVDTKYLENFKNQKGLKRNKINEEVYQTELKNIKKIEKKKSKQYVIDYGEKSLKEMVVFVKEFLKSKKTKI